MKHPRTLPMEFESLTILKGYVPTTTDCPSCGQPLMMIEMAQHTKALAPYLCTIERRAFWPVELCPAARKQYRAHQRDWGPTARWLRLAVNREHVL